MREEPPPLEPRAAGHSTPPSAADGTSHIRDGVGQAPIPHQVPYLQTFQGNQIVRTDERARCLTGEVLALPLEGQVHSSHALPRLLPVGRLALGERRGWRRGCGRRRRDGERCWVLGILVLSRPLARSMVVPRL